MKSWCPRPIPRRSSVPAVRHPVNSAAVSPSPSLRLVNNTKCSRQTNIAAHFTVAAVRFIAIRKVALSNEYCFFPFLWPGFTVQFYLRVETIGGIVAAIDIGKKNVSRSPASLDHLSNIIARVRHARRNSIYRHDLEPTSSSRIAFRFARWSAANNLVAIPFTISFFLRTVFRFVHTRRSMECKKVVLRGGHWAAFKVDEDDRPYRPTSSKHNRKFPPITYSPRSNPFLLRFIPSIFPSLFALASSIYPLGKLGHSGMDLSKWKRNLANGRERERDGLTIYRPVIPITRDLQRTESEITGGVEVSVSLKGSPVTASSFRPGRFLSLNLLSFRMYTLSKGEGPSPLVRPKSHCPRRTKTDDSNCFSS